MLDTEIKLIKVPKKKPPPPVPKPWQCFNSGQADQQAMCIPPIPCGFFFKAGSLTCKQGFSGQRRHLGWYRLGFHPSSLRLLRSLRLESVELDLFIRSLNNDRLVPLSLSGLIPSFSNLRSFVR